MYKRLHVKSLAELCPLLGKKETITVMEFRSSPGLQFQKVEMGMEITVIKNGKPVAIISKPEPIVV